MKYLCMLCVIVLCLSCGRAETFQTTKAEKWILLENAYLFQEAESLEKIKKLKTNIQRKKLLNNEVAIQEDKEWEETYLDFSLDYSKILKASDSLFQYEILDIEKSADGYVEHLNNGMRIEFSSSFIMIHFPKEESDFHLAGKFLYFKNRLTTFQGFEIGGIFIPKEAELDLLSSKNILHIYDSPLSDRAWEKIFLLSLEYCNQSLTRNSKAITKISPKNFTLKLERKIYE